MFKSHCLKVLKIRYFIVQLKTSTRILKGQVNQKSQYKSEIFIKLN